MENWDSKTLEEARVSISQLKHAIRELPRPSQVCEKHQSSTYNGQAVWCKHCGSIWLIDDIIEKTLNAR